ncbi:carotenoid oxygenase family protein [Microbulbifer sp. MLAF003]|uniref:carotenoid oxygenase family protein n=1 Tax=Microbulbifer sp. MLAF003 TaxID=3032582 RepID=UPI0024AD6894|nr:carotenoid oxygenase family protein [Microbulbifer sp. MLAF003]WHI49650.1 carotenoid oxygenase family protein [Microbulbifer sp. MLAF003]
MKRRDLLKAAGAISALPLAGMSSMTAQARSKITDTDFPESIMYGSLEDSSGHLSVIQGNLPDDVTGHLLMAEGIPIAPNHLTPNGKGALTRLDFSGRSNNSNVAYTRKMIRTASAIMQEQDLSGFDKFNLLGGTIYSSPNLGFMNYCNTAPNYMGDNRFAMSYEGGMPYEFDATTLEMITPIGEVDEWESSLPPLLENLTPKKWLFPQIRTTGHPFFDLETGECITINYGGNMGDSGRSGFIRLISWDQQGAFKSWNIRDRQGNSAYIAASSHSLGVTRNHVVIFETAARVESTRILGTRIVLPQEHRTRCWVLRKADMIAGREDIVADYLELGFDTSDIVCNYDDSAGEITLYGQYMGAMDKSEQLFRYEILQEGGLVPSWLSGYPAAPVDVGGLVRARIQVTSGSAREIKEDYQVIRDERLLWDMNDPAYRGHFQFPETFEHLYWAAVGYRPNLVSMRVSWAYRNYPERHFGYWDMPEESRPSALVHMDCKQMRIADAYQFPDDCVMRTPQFMARPGSTAQNDGYLIAAVVRKNPTTSASNGKEFWIFDAAALSRGPLCILASTSLEFATTNHALWVPSIGRRPIAAYRSGYGDFLRGKAPDHSGNVQDIINRELLPRFG